MTAHATSRALARGARQLQVLQPATPATHDATHPGAVRALATVPRAVTPPTFTRSAFAVSASASSSSAPASSRLLSQSAPSALFWGNADNGRIGLPRASVQVDKGAGGLGYCMSVPTAVTFGGARMAAPPSPSSLPRIQQIALGGAHSLVLLTDGTLYSFGLGSEGQLGIARPMSAAEAAAADVPTDNRDMASARTSTDQFAAASAAAAGGSGIDSAAGSSSPSSSSPSSTYVSAASSGFNLLFDRVRSRLPKSIFSTAFSQWTPTRVPHIPERVTCIAAGTAHSLAVTDSGQVYAWGRGALGQLGVLIGGERDGTQTEISRAARDVTSVAEPPEYMPSPRRLDALVDAGVEIKSAAAGGDFTVLLARDGTVFTCGNGVQGQLGVGEREMGTGSSAFRKLGATAPLPRKVRALSGEPIDAVYAGASTVLALTAGDAAATATPSPSSSSSADAISRKRRGIVWGNGHNGLLGTGVTGLNAYDPLPLDTLGGGIDRVAFGDAHAMVLTEDDGDGMAGGDAAGVYAWGNNEHGCLGLNLNQAGNCAVSTPQRVESLDAVTRNGGEVVDIAAGFQVSYALVRGAAGTAHADNSALDGTERRADCAARTALYSWGNGQSGALGRGGRSAGRAARNDDAAAQAGRHASPAADDNDAAAHRDRTTGGGSGDGVDDEEHVDIWQPALAAGLPPSGANHVRSGFLHAAVY